MLTLGPGERAALWRRTLTTPSQDRAAMRRILGREMQEALGALHPVYRDLDERFERTLHLLDKAGLLVRNDLRRTFESIGEETGRPSLFHAPGPVAVLAAALEDAGGEGGLTPEERGEAVRLAGAWRGQVRAGRWRAVPGTASVAEAAALLGVSEATVYQRCKAGEISSERDEAGRIVIPTDQLALGARVRETRVAGARRSDPSGSDPSGRRRGGSS